MLRSRLRRRVVAIGAIALITVVGQAVAAWGSFSASDKAAHTLSSTTLQPASNLSVSTSCPLLLGPTADLTWTATPSTFASGYKVERWRGSTLEATTTVAPRTTTSLTQTGLQSGTTYTWRVYAYYLSWTSTVISATRSTPGLCL
jgi:hypothetical protein